MIASVIISSNDLKTSATLEASGGMTNTYKGDVDMGILAYKQCGIYEIRNTVNGHRYIGSAVYIGRRWKYHLQQLRASKHHNLYLQRAFNLYGEAAFSFAILEECSVFDLIHTEQFYIDKYNPEYNIARVAGSPLGVKHTEETKAKVKKSLIGNKRALGHKHTEEWKQENAKRMSGNKHSLGVKQSVETRIKKSLSGIGKHLGSKPWLGRKHTEETKEKIRNAQKGIPKTEEHKQKLRESRRLYLQRKKEVASD